MFGLVVAKVLEAYDRFRFFFDSTHKDHYERCIGILRSVPSVYSYFIISYS